MSRLEKTIEGKFVSELRKWSLAHGVETLCWKLNAIGIRGLPDRLILWPNRGIFFIEFKRPDKSAGRLQQYTHKILQKFGFEVEVHDDEFRAMEATTSRILASLGATESHEVDGTGGGL